MSNILLAYIFFDVFRDQMEADQAEAESEKLQDELDKAKPVEFDAEGELDARIWNNF
jgi:hypothetical protein